MIGDTRAVSPAVTQALTIGISTILVTGLLIGGTSFVETQQESIAQQGLTDVGAGVASDLVRLDQVDKTGLSQNLTFRSHYPNRIARAQYRVTLVPDSQRTTIHLNSTAQDASTQIRFENTTDVCQSRTLGGTITVAYDATQSCLVVSNG